MNGKNVLFVGDINIINPFFNALDGSGHMLEVAVNYDEVMSLTDKNSFDFAFVYVNTNHQKTYHTLEHIAQYKNTKLFIITDDFTGNTMSNISNHIVESVIFFPTKKEYINDLVQEYFVEPKGNNYDTELRQTNNRSELLFDHNQEDAAKASVSKTMSNNDNTKKISYNDGQPTQTKGLKEEKGILEDQIIFDFTDDDLDNNIEPNLSDQAISENILTSSDNDISNVDQGIAIRPPRLKVNTPVSDILSQKERQIRIKNVPEIIVDSDKKVSDNKKKEKGLLGKIKQIFE